MNGEGIIMSEEKMTEVTGGAATSGKGEQWTRGGKTFYRVAMGDTLPGIAQRFNTSSEEIRALNPVLIKTFDEVRVGWELRVR